MANVLMILSVATCFAIGVVARHMIGLVVGVGLSGIIVQLASLSVTIASAMMSVLIMGWVTTSELLSTMRRGFYAAGFWLLRQVGV